MRLVPLLITCAFLGGSAAGCGARPPWKGVTKVEEVAEVNHHRILGLALLENGDPEEAAEEFTLIQKAQPGLAFGFVNRAAALVQVESRVQEALEDAQQAVKLLPTSAPAHLVLGRAYQATGKADLATTAYQKAVELDPNHLRAAGALIAHLETQPGGSAANVYPLWKKLEELAPGNAAVQLGWAKAQATRGEQTHALASLMQLPDLLVKLPAGAAPPFQKARALLADGKPVEASVFEAMEKELKASPQFNADRQKLFGRANDPADLAMREWGTDPPALAEPPLLDFKIQWVDRTADFALDAYAVEGLAPVAAGDLDLWREAGKLTAAGGERARIQDRPELITGGTPKDIAWNAKSGFAASTAGAGMVASPLLADLNNDFSLDLFVAGAAGDRVWINPVRSQDGEMGLTFKGSARGAWAAAANPGGSGPGTAMAVDLDLDGDLDIVRSSSAAGQPAARFLRNDGNFKLTDVTSATGLSVPSQGARQTVFGDFDGDGDPDLFTVREHGACQLFLSQRGLRFRNATKAWGIETTPGARSASVADFDRDGDWDLIVTGVEPHGTVIYRNTGHAFEADREALPELSESSRHDRVEFLDYDNDSWIDIAMAGSAGIRLYRNDLGAFSVDEPPFADVAITGLLPLDFDMDGDLDLLTVTDRGRLRLTENSGGHKRPWIKVEVHGLTKAGARSNNRYGIGATINAKTHWDQQPVLVTGPQTHLGLGRIDYVTALRTVWTHGVPQNKLRARTGDTVVMDQSAQEGRQEFGLRR